ncbi:hypothetical protein TYRP_015126 [Tyrophagus putrescentiae]|nr:hypothetical protein TYRP_015126 [Tyrophagus putrescentiae]
MSVNQASSYYLKQNQQNQQNPNQQPSKTTRPLTTGTPSSYQQQQQQNLQQQPGHPIISYGVQQQQQNPYQPYNTWSGTYPGQSANPNPFQSHQQYQYQRMWPLVRRLFPAEENLLKTIFVVHLAFLAFFVLNRDVQLNNAYLLPLQRLLHPPPLRPLHPDALLLVQLVAIAVDCFVLFKLFSRYSTEENVQRYVYWLLLLVVRLLTLVLLRKLWADRVAAALDVYGFNNGQIGGYQLTPSVSATQKMTSPSPLLSSQRRQPVNFTVGGGGRGGVGDNYGNQAAAANREAYLYEASLNA